MTMTAALENQLMLAHLLGVNEDEAASLLDARVAITSSAGYAAIFCDELEQQLCRTINVVPSSEPCDLEVVIGTVASAQAKKQLYVTIDDEVMVVSSGLPTHDISRGEPHGLQIVIGACYAASVVLAHVIEGLEPPTEKFEVNFGSIGANVGIMRQNIILGEVALVGAGAIGNAFLRAARHLQISGKLMVVDPKNVGAGNPNRCLYFSETDIGKPKASILSLRAQGDFPALVLEAREQTFKDFINNRGKVRRVIVATDSPRVRRSIQKELPLEVIDASTTDVSEIIIHSHRQPNSGACLACIYKHTEDELSRERDIAAGLGISLETVTSGKLIDGNIAEEIVVHHPQLKAEDLIGKAFDSLFKQLCAEQLLLDSKGIQVLAPFAFVSSLAGAMLALELLRFESGIAFSEKKNYMYLSPWKVPHSHLRRFRIPVTDCDFCSSNNAKMALKAIWPEDI